MLGLSRMQAPFKSAISTNDRAHQMAIRPSRAHRASVLANAVRPRHQACEEATSSASVQGLAAAAAAVAASLTLTIAVPADVLAASSQAEMRAPGVQTITYGLDVAGRIQGCSVNPNCVSTSSTSETYGPAWKAYETDPKKAAKDLESNVALLYGEQGAKLLAAESVGDSSEYRAFGINSAFGQDLAEFLIKSESVPGQGRPTVIVTYRAQAGSIKYIYPFQVPITDFGMNRDRLTGLRESLGWQIIGCDLKECYE